MINRPKQIIVHHSATKDSGTVSWGAIRKYHVETNKWRDIGYHAGIEMVGDHYECMVGRDVKDVGAHCEGHNAGTLGFCFVGDYDVKAPDLDMLVMAAEKVLIPWCQRFGIRPAWIVGHRDYSPKTCPGNLFDIELLKEIVAERLK